MTRGSGILLVDKPGGITSARVVGRIRKVLGVRRVGHAGTLDPDATGLLVIGVGRATRLLTFLVGLDKKYVATIRLGVSTMSDDAAGAVVEARGASGDLDVEGGIALLTGSIRQRPSAVSAIQVGGRRAYRRVLAGESVELPERAVNVYRLELLDRAATEQDGTRVLDLRVRLDVSSGTYVRAIARDLGRYLGVGGHVTELRRTRVGPFDVVDAQPVAALERGEAPRLLSPGSAAARVLPTAVLGAEEAEAVSTGVRIPSDAADGGPVALLAEGGALLAVAESVDARWRYRMVVPRNP